MMKTANLIKFVRSNKNCPYKLRMHATFRHDAYVRRKRETESPFDTLVNVFNIEWLSLIMMLSLLTANSYMCAHTAHSVYILLHLKRMPQLNTNSLKSRFVRLFHCMLWKHWHQSGFLCENFRNMVTRGDLSKCLSNSHFDNLFIWLY